MSNESDEPQLPAKVAAQFRDSLSHIVGANRAPTLKDDIDPLSIFFTKWFIESGHSYYLLFLQNAKATNLQFAELLPLIKANLRFDGDEEVNHPDQIEFLSSDEFKQSARDFFEYFSSRDLPTEKLLARYWKQVANKIVVEPYFGSCSIFLPPNIDLDCAQVCAESGYIHSIGDLVLVRNASKITQDMITDRIRSYLDRVSHDRPVLLRPYTHEDFTEHDRSAVFLRNGLDDIKIHLSKSSIEDVSLFSALRAVESQISQKNPDFKISDPGNFNESLQGYRDTHGDNFQCWWLVIDSAIDAQFRLQGDKKYFILYNQKFKNDNYYHLFDEDKPGWLSHTTLPHTMAAAMLNLTRPWPTTTDFGFRVCDPFGGSGTVYFETHKFGDVTAKTYDRSPGSVRMVELNAKFFRSSSEELEAISGELEEFSKHVESFLKKSSANKQATKKEVAAGNLVSVIQSELQAANWDGLELSAPQWANIDAAAKDATVDAYAVFLVIKALMRSREKIQLGYETYATCLRKEYDRLSTGIASLAKIRNKVISGETGSGRFQEFRGKYSTSLIPPMPSQPLVDLFEHIDVFVQDVLNLPKNQFDVIICDPPYGFNTEDDIFEIYDLHYNLADRLIAALKQRGGQLVISLPEISFTGKPIPPFVRKRYLVSRLIRLAHTYNYEMYQPAQKTPLALCTVKPPYYWYSEKALKRFVLHFHFRRKAW